MDTNAPEWNDYLKRFTELADLADGIDPPAPPLDRCQYYLCLYGENGLKPAEEFEFLEKMDAFAGQGLSKVEVTTSYWEDVVLFVP